MPLVGAPVLCVDGKVAPHARGRLVFAFGRQFEDVDGAVFAGTSQQRMVAKVGRGELQVADLSRRGAPAELEGDLGRASRESKDANDGALARSSGQKSSRRVESQRLQGGVVGAEGRAVVAAGQGVVDGEAARLHGRVGQQADVAVGHGAQAVGIGGRLNGVDVPHFGCVENTDLFLQNDGNPFVVHLQPAHRRLEHERSVCSPCRRIDQVQAPR